MKYGVTPTGNTLWDQGILRLVQQKKKEEADALLSLSHVVTKSEKEISRARQSMPDLSDQAVFSAHMELLRYVADEIVLRPQRRRFEVDECNSDVIRFLLYYFNECDLAETVFPGFYNVSVTQMVNYYSIHNNIDRFLYNERESKTFQGSPLNLCLNDIGVDNRPFYGIDTQTIVSDFLHARNEIWGNLSEYARRFAHLTTNLTNEQLSAKFASKDEYGRIVDRFKTYNVIPLPGKSRR